MASTEDWEWGAAEGWGAEESTALVPSRAGAQGTTKAPTKAPTQARRISNKSVVQPWQTCSKKDIEVYRKYKVLYDERKFAQEYVAEAGADTQLHGRSACGNSSPYLRPPFHTPGDYFELWAPHDKTTGEKKWKNLFLAHASNKKALQIMRLSKKIRDEVAHYFYGRLSVRFSSGGGFLVMTMFNHSIRPLKCSFIKHITVRLPLGDLSNITLRNWERLERAQARRGLRIPYIGLREKRRSRGYTEAQQNYDITVRRGFRQHGNMAGLKLLEVLVPWDYLSMNSVVYDGNWKATRVPCECGDFQSLSPEDQVRHIFEGDCGSENWELLADLKQSSSDDLTIALVYDYNSTRRGRHFEDCTHDHDRLRDNFRRGRWLAAYASVMGYKFGYARLAEKGTYTVRYDEDTLMSDALELIKNDPFEYGQLLEPPELCG